MLRFYLKELISDRSFQRGRKITQQEIADATGIARSTLSKIQSKYDYVTTTENIDRLCDYLDCEVGDLIKRVKTTKEKPAENDSDNG